MGNQLGALPPTQQDYSIHLHELNDYGISSEETLGQGRILKTLRCIHDEGTIVVKVYRKSGEDNALVEQIEKMMGGLSFA
jgi:phosphoinositide-3-kinase regulatory subunit 4